MMEKHNPAEVSSTGLIGQWVTLGADLAHRVVGTCFGILEDVRAETSQRVEATIEFVSASQQGTIRLVSGIHKRVDALSKEALAAGELALTGAVYGVKATSDEATRMASRTASLLVRAPAAAN